MKKIKKLNPGGIYLVKSLASANSTYFEDDLEIGIFWKHFNAHLRNYVHVVDYLINEKGFQMIIKIKSEKTIIRNYLRFKRFKNQGFVWDNRECWRIISEKFRVCLGQFVPEVNAKRGCNGSLVKNRFERYFFDSIEEFEAEREKMKHDVLEENQQNVSYRGKVAHQKLDKRNDKLTYLWNSCLARIKTDYVFLVEKLSQCVNSQLVKTSLLAKWIKYTFCLHQQIPPTIFSTD